MSVQISCPDTIWFGPEVIVGGKDVALGVDVGVREAFVNGGVGENVGAGVDESVEVCVGNGAGISVEILVAVELEARKSFVICPGKLQLRSKKQTRRIPKMPSRL